jgi:hypothetical protein
MGITTAVYGSIESTPEGIANPMLKYVRVFQTCVAFAAAGILFVPFLRIGTQGNAPKLEDDSSQGGQPGEQHAADEKKDGDNSGLVAAEKS